ncbi:DUF3563 domain-containing protein [Segnochrobactrum spirostomi]|uniref:DUF3563 domain-containing protein n=1 Tax=Segnochrobactrum spirostomi TaxID=2608987 RepID=A0A6A7XZS3_9HYPH|nr:DUF3563 domain-containing protein [Segnochrobactrum spirostomi]MQT11975.1 DUF3563 domain-containing protein [Segnochrobactrum spirostomi]
MFKPVTHRLAAAWKRFNAYSPELDYLNAAGDRIDLESRQREIDRGRFQSRPFGY